MTFGSGGWDRWQRQVRQLQHTQQARERASYLRTQRETAAREVLRANEHLSNITAAYLEACRIAGIRPV